MKTSSRGKDEFYYQTVLQDNGSGQWTKTPEQVHNRMAWIGKTKSAFGVAKPEPSPKPSRDALEWLEACHSRDARRIWPSMPGRIAKIPPEPCQDLIHSYRKHLVKVIAGVNKLLIRRVPLLFPLLFFWNLNIWNIEWVGSIKGWKFRIFCVIIFRHIISVSWLRWRSDHTL